MIGRVLDAHYTAEGLLQPTLDDAIELEGTVGRIDKSDVVGDLSYSPDEGDGIPVENAYL